MSETDGKRPGGTLAEAEALHSVDYDGLTLESQDQGGDEHQASLEFQLCGPTIKAKGWRLGDGLFGAGALGEDSQEEDHAEGRAFVWSSLWETLLLLGGILLANYFWHPQDPGYLAVAPHPFWAVILLVSVRYVFAESLVAALVVAATYCYFSVHAAGGNYSFSTLDLFAEFTDPLLFLLVAGGIGGYTQHLLDRTGALRRRLREKDAEVERIDNRHRAAIKALREIESRVTGEFTNILNLFASLAHVRQLDSTAIKQNLAEALETYLRAEEVVFYDVERGDLVPRQLAGAKQPKSVDADRDLVLMEAYRTKAIAHLDHFTSQSDLDQYQDASLLAGPLLDAAGNCLGLVGIQKMPFIDYNAHSFRLFDTMLSWWSNILDERLRLDELRERSVFNEELGLYNYAYFTSRIAQEFERAKRFSLPVSVALLKIEDYEQIPMEKRQNLRLTLAQIIGKNISELEMASCYKSDEVISISFPIMMGADAQMRLEQIAKKITAFDLRPYGQGGQALRFCWALTDYKIGMESVQALLSEVERLLFDAAPTTSPEQQS